MAEDIRCPQYDSETMVRIAIKGLNAGQRSRVYINYPECKGKVPISEEGDPRW